MNLTDIKLKPISELVDIATELGLEDVGRLKKQDIIYIFYCHVYLNCYFLSIADLQFDLFVFRVMLTDLCYRKMLE